MDERTIMDALFLLLTDGYEVEDTALAEVDMVVDYEAAGLLTRDKGLILRMQDGSEFQLTINRRR
jgi:hypothetical protein